MNAYSDGYWLSDDGLRLHYRDYPGREDRPPLLCLPGLTRNARDFENLAQRFAGGWRVLCPEMRGRGQSAYAPDWRSYTPQRYVADVKALFAQAGITRYVAIGTSLGGLMTMIMAMIDAGPIAGALLNDIGPVLESAGIDRIREYVGQGRDFANWVDAANALHESQAGNYPDYGSDDWLAMARRVMTQSANGRIAFDYDIRIAQGFVEAGADIGVDLWPGIEALTGKPMVLVRGGMSQLLAAQTFARMRRLLPDAEAVVLPRTGHAPTLDEPEVTAALERMLARIA